MNLEKDFDNLIASIREERKKLEKVLRSLSADDIEDYSYHLEAFKTAILPMIQDITDRIISWVKTSNMDDLATLEKLCSQEDLNYYKFRSLVRMYGGNYWNNRYLHNIAFLRDFDDDGLCQPIECQYQLLLNLYDRILYLSDPSTIDDDSLSRFEGLFYGMI